MAKWPTRSANRCAFLESIGVDPATVLEDGISSEGYYTLSFAEDGKQKLVIDGEFLRTHWNWKPGEWAGYTAAFNEDFRVVRAGK